MTEITFFSGGVIDIVETPLESFSGIFSSSMIAVACSMQLFDLQLSDNILRSLIRACREISNGKFSVMNLREKALLICKNLFTDRNMQMCIFMIFLKQQILFRN